MKFNSKAEEKYYYERVAPEADFLEWYANEDLPQYEKPSVTVDNVMLCYDKEAQQLKMLLIKRIANPFRNCWALPGGFVDKQEATTATCLRETREETGIELTKDAIYEIGSFSQPNRDPRGWTITISYLALLPTMPTATAGDDAKEAQWFDVSLQGEQLLLSLNEQKMTIDLMSKKSDKTSLAFDHEAIIRSGFKKLFLMEKHPHLETLLGKTHSLEELKNKLKK
ncbi:NUDIX domain-containing protein [Carnobacterium divergens]|uniref:NUDIX domain-containing protein n=1 Tax=Carnobacterium divergens TaxID=2748 RepID=UPI0039B03C2D